MALQASHVGGMMFVEPRHPSAQGTMRQDRAGMTAGTPGRIVDWSPPNAESPVAVTRLGFAPADVAMTGVAMTCVAMTGPV